MTTLDYDVIIIGSGMSGLTAGLSVAQAGQKALIIEQHSLPGGWSQSFPLHHHMFSPGIHYIGELGPGERIRRLLEDMDVADDLTFTELNTDAYDRAICPQAEFNFPKGIDALSERLCEMFPGESRNIKKFINTCNRFISEWEEANYFTNGNSDIMLLPLKAPTIARFAFYTFQNLLDHFFKDPKLKWVLSTQCLDSGLSPGNVSGPFQAIVNWHYARGGYYPKGGVKKIVSAFIKKFRKAGGTLMMGTSVSKILIENTGKPNAVGVELKDGTSLRCKKVISTADAGTTYGRLVGLEHLSGFLRWRLKRTRYSASCGSMFMITNAPPEDLGMDSGNIFYSAGMDLNSMYKQALSPKILSAEEFPVMFLSSESAKNPAHSNKRNEYTASAFVPLNHTTFSDYSDTKYGSRDANYTAAKNRVGEMIIRSVEKVVPSIREHLIDFDVSTPLTNTHYIGGEQGSMYGTEKSIEFIGPFAYRIQTPIKNLLMCGHSTVAHGFIGSVISGRVAAAKVLGCKLSELKRPEN